MLKLEGTAASACGCTSEDRRLCEIVRERARLSETVRGRPGWARRCISWRAAARVPVKKWRAWGGRVGFGARLREILRDCERLRARACVCIVLFRGGGR